MKRDLWKELAKRAQVENPAPIEMPFRFEEGVLSALRRGERPAWNPLSLWLPVLRPALGLAFAISIACAFFNNQSPVIKPTVDFVSETESMIQTAVLQ